MDVWKKENTLGKDKDEFLKRMMSQKVRNEWCGEI